MPTAANTTTNTITNTVSLPGNSSGLTSISTNGTGTISIGSYTPGIINSTWSLFNNYMSPKMFKIGDSSVRVYNVDNKYFIVDNVHFDFEVSSTTVKMKINVYGSSQLNSLDELRNYIKTVKLYYLKAKEFEKQLNISSDFT